MQKEKSRRADDTCAGGNHGGLRAGMCAEPQSEEVLRAALNEARIPVQGVYRLMI